MAAVGRGMRFSYSERANIELMYRGEFERALNAALGFVFLMSSHDFDLRWPRRPEYLRDGIDEALQERSFCKQRALYIARPDWLDLLADAGQIRRPSHANSDGTFATAFAGAIPEVFVRRTQRRTSNA